MSKLKRENSVRNPLRSSKKLQKNRSISSVSLRRSLSRSSMTSQSIKQTLYEEPIKKKEKFIPTQLREKPHKEASNFQSKHFNTEYFVDNVFSSKDSPEILNVIDNLSNKRDECSNLLRDQVFGNYNHFIDSTHYLQQLENNMASLRHLFIEQQQKLYSISQVHESTSQFSVKIMKMIENNNNQYLNDNTDNKLSLYIFNEIDSLITQRKFIPVIEIIEHYFQSNNDYSPLYCNNMEERIVKLSQIFCKEIQYPSIQQNECICYIEYLIRLKEPTLARETLLNTRWDYINTKIREIKLKGNLISYIAELSQIIFSFISNTCKEYQKIFNESQMMSAFIVWVTELLDLFCSIFSRHVYASKDDSCIKECIEIANEHCLVLENEGLMLSFYLKRLMNKNKKLYISTC